MFNVTMKSSRSKGPRGRQSRQDKSRVRWGRRIEFEPLEARTLLSVNLIGTPYAGLNVDAGGGYAPPDTVGAAGTTSYVETVNQAIAIYTPKATGTTSVSRTLNDFWFTQGGLAAASPTSGLSDPIVVWDDQVNRFIIGDQDVDNTNQINTFDIAISRSASPATLTTADWFFYQVTTTETGRNADYPGNFGYNRDAFVFTLNQNQAVSGAGSVVHVGSININDMVAGNALVTAGAGQNVFLNDTAGFSIRPTVMHDSVAGGPMWLIESTAGNDNDINVIRMTNVLSAAPTFTTFNRGVNAYQGVVQPRDPGGQITPNSGNNGALWTHILKAAEFNNTIVAVDQISVSATEDVARWYSINVSDVNNPTIADQGNVTAGNNNYVVFPAIDINSKGDIAMTYLQSGTGANQFVSMYVTGRRAGDAAGTMETPVLVQAGAANLTAGREGDLSGINVDADGTFWAANQWASTTTGLSNPNRNWGTTIAHFALGTKPVLTAASDQTATEGTAKSFSLGSFTDPDDGPWSVKVSWGDGTPDTNFNVAAAGSLGTQSHTYAEESAADHPGSNPYKVTVTVTDSTLLADSKTFNVTVSDPDVNDLVGQAIAPVEGADTGSVLIATFKDPGGPETVADYSADIDWGDGTGTQVGAGSITLNGTTFEVRGSHTYAEESAADHPGSNPYQISITVHHEASTPQTVVSTATVSDPAVIATGGFAFVAVEGVPSAVQTVATFTDPGGAEAIGDYTALIDWGDGTAASAGTITFAAGTYTVQGGHTYAVGLGLPDDFGNTFCDGTPPSYHKPITVTVSHELAPTAQAVSDAKIAIAPGTAHLAGGSLIVVATTADDLVVVNPVGNTGAVNVALNATSLGSFTLGAGGRIIVAGLAGDDNIQVAGGVTLPTVLYGGPGNDRLKGGDGSNILVGCAGDDQLNGGNAHDLLIGGDGADRIIGASGDDTLIAANLLNAITLVEDTKFSDLIAALNGGSILADDDGDVDVLTGAAGIDTFFYNYQGILPLDIVTDKAEVAFDV